MADHLLCDISLRSDEFQQVTVSLSPAVSAAPHRLVDCSSSCVPPVSRVPQPHRCYPAPTSLVVTLLSQLNSALVDP